MDNYCIFGTMGSGKSIFCKRIILQKKYNSSFSYPILWIEIDEVVHFWHSQKRIRDELYRIWKKNGVISVKQNERISKNKILFFSYSLQKKRAWKSLEILFHSLLRKFIQETIEKKKNKKGSILWDMALSDLFPKNKKVQYIHMPSKSVYETIFLLKKYRGVEMKKILFFLQKQIPYK